jgi:N-acylglucosamine 2-epimerase
MVMNLDDLRDQYRALLLDGIAPFWLKHGIDWQHGGVLSCMKEDGTPVSGDKYIWSQARSVWTFSALYNRIERNPEFLRAAENSVRFLLEHGRDEQGRWVYHTTREGQPVDGHISIYADCFAVYGLSEYLRAVHDEKLLKLARATYDRVVARVEQPDFHEVAPYPWPPHRQFQAVSMMLTEVTNELIATTGDYSLESILDRHVERVMSRFLRPERKLLFEFLSEDWQELPPPEGTAVMPGHAIECMWFVMHVAARRGDRDLARRAAEVVRWHLEAGWDPQYGGIFLGIDAEGHAPYLGNADKKLWWPHTEALYALLLADRLTGEPWCMEWYEKVHEWSWARFPMPESGEWWQRLDCRGNRMTELIALPVKDPFHLPRAATLIVELLEGRRGFDR